MALTLTKLRNVIVHRLGATVASQLDQDDIINEAGRLLVQMHPSAGWKFLERPVHYASFIAPADITGATWTESSKTLTKTSAFTNALPGDPVQITDGTGATTGMYVVASRTSANAVVLTTSIGSAADGQTDIAATLTYPYALLPSDFGQLVAYDYNNLNGEFRFTDFHGLLSVRTQNVSPAGVTWGCIVHPTQTSSAAAPANPRIELAPTPTAAVASALALTYRAGWTELTYSTGSEIPNIPPYMDPLLRELVACVAQGYEEADNASLSARLDEIQNGPVFRNAVRYDSMRQPDYGEMYGGAVEGMTTGGRLPFSSIAGPS